eukprot:EG_transcript_38921
MATPGIRPVLQTDFSPGTGNALQACVATVLSLPLADVPNFIAAPDYLAALQEFLRPHRLAFLKVSLTPEGRLLFPLPGAQPVCLLTGKSPRGDHKHVVVAQVVDGSSFQTLHDPHPDGRGLDGALAWAGFFVALCPTA